MQHPYPALTNLINSLREEHCKIKAATLFSLSLILPMFKPDRFAFSLTFLFPTPLSLKHRPHSSLVPTYPGLDQAEPQCYLINHPVDGIFHACPALPFRSRFALMRVCGA